MGQEVKGPRLVLKRGADRSPVWFVRHGLRMRSTGMPEERRDDAEVVLKAYCDALGSPPEHREPTTNARPDTLYFLSCEAPDFPVKIGTTSNLPLRMKALGVALPYEIVLLAAVPGNQDDERSFHVGFATSRLRGEWFARTPELMELINNLKESRT